ncbi:MAG: dipeptidase [Thermomicrobiales bacterium]|nr:dipeptidase [Thermomicrobiales bacterium]
MIPFFDGHNDTVLSIRETGRSFFERSDEGHVDLPRAQEGGLAGGFFAVWVPDPGVAVDPDDPDTSVKAYEDVASMPPQMETSYAQNHALSSLATLFRVEAESNGSVKIVRTAADLRDCIETGTFAMELHIEGAEPIDEGLDALEVFHRAGLRSLGIVWSRSNLFGSGVPFAFPSSPDTGPGLTEAGRALVRACNRLGIMLDLSHLNEKGFWDVADRTEDPRVATHSGVHAITPTARNLTDKQLDAIRDSDGVVGVNFHVGFLHPEGNASADATSLTAIVDHLEYMVSRMGIDQVAMGSDFDGAVMPGDLKDAAGMQKIAAELRTRGYDDAALKKIAYENWLRVFEKTWGE